MRIQERLSVWRARYWRSPSWISLLKIDEEAIIDFASNSFKSFVYSLYFISLCAENFVKLGLCAAAEAGDVSFI